MFVWGGGAPNRNRGQAVRDGNNGGGSIKHRKATADHHLQHRESSAEMRASMALPLSDPIVSMQIQLR